MSTSRIKIIQINIYKGRYLDSLVDFLKAENPDFITMQEVTEGSFNLSQGFGGNIFDLLKDRLGMQGVYNFDLICDDGAKMGNAVLGKHKLLESFVLTLRNGRVYGRDEFAKLTRFETIPRHLIDVVFKLGDTNLHVASWHGAWTAPPADTKETFRQSTLVYKYLKALEGPFILGGDLNAIIGSKTVDIIGKVANNLMLDSPADMTTNPKVHKIAPLGFLIDYIFVSSEFKVKSLRVPQVTVSDHLPVVAEVEISL